MPLLKKLIGRGFVVAVFFLASAPIHADSPESVHLSQFEHSAWRLQDGVFTGAPLGIAQTKDGYLWIGTVDGLVRFDGVRFVPWKLPPQQTSRSFVIRSLLAARDGSLWIGTTTGLAHWTNGQLVTYPGPVAYIEAIFQSRDGTIWITRSRIRDWSGPICRVEGAKLHCFGKADGIAANSAHPIVEDVQGNLWFGGSGALIQRTGEKFLNYRLPAIEVGNDLYTINGLANGSDGAITVGLGFTGRHLGLQEFNAGQWKAVSTSGFHGSTHDITTTFRDRDGCLWVGTEHSGIYRITKHQADSFDRTDGLSSNNITGFQQDSEGDVWVTTAAGLDVFRKRPVRIYSSREGLTGDSVQAVVERKSGGVWISNATALDLFSEGKVRTINARDGLPGRSPSSLLEDHEGRLWLGVDTGLFVYTNGRFITIKPLSLHDVVCGLAEDSRGDIWAVIAGLSPRLIRIRNFKIQEELRPPEIPPAFGPTSDRQGGIWINLLQHGLVHLQDGNKQEFTMRQFDAGERGPLTVFNMLVEADGTLWGASNRGLVGYRGGKAQILDEKNGLPCSGLYSVINDEHSAIWIFSHCGLIRIGRDEIDRWWANPNVSVHMRLFDAADGVQPGIPLFRPAAIRSANGELWFATGKELMVVDPDRLETNLNVPPVHIEQLIADEHEYPVSGRPALPPLTRNVQIEYTALSFMVPKRVRFRYRLDGYETKWQDPGTRRAAYYSNLRPGHYTFHVRACNNDGLWNDTGAALTFVVLPAVYQTQWFLMLVGVATLLLFYALYLLRVRSVTARVQERMNERMLERERIARELHDTLLQGFQGLVLRFQAVMKLLPDQERTREAMERALQRADDILLEGRQSVRNLREEGATGNELSESLALFGKELAQDHTSLFSLVIVGPPEPLSPIVFDETYRIAREALINAFQHSEARKVEIELTYRKGGVSLRVRDDGVGIDPQILHNGKLGHWGLSGMRERALKLGAQLMIWSLADAGTEIELTVPAKIAYLRPHRKSFWQQIRHRGR